INLSPPAADSKAVKVPLIRYSLNGENEADAIIGRPGDLQQTVKIPLRMKTARDQFYAGAVPEIRGRLTIGVRLQLDGKQGPVRWSNNNVDFVIRSMRALEKPIAVY